MARKSDRPVDDFEWIPGTLEELGKALTYPEPRRISVDLQSGQMVSGIRWGDETPEVLYLHGGGQNAHTWDLVVALVGTPALAIDLPGHGHSSWRADRDYRPVTGAKAVADALNLLAVRPKLVVGMSQGGLTSLALAGLDPALVPELVLVDILPQLGAQAVPYDRTNLGSVSLIDGPREFETLQEMEQLTDVATGGKRPGQMLRRGVWHNAVQIESGRWRWRYDNLVAGQTLDHTGLWDTLSTMSAGITLVKGGASPLITGALVDGLTALRSDARLIVVPGAGHAVQSDAPQLLAEIIEDQLDRLSPYARRSAKTYAGATSERSFGKDG